MLQDIIAQNYSKLNDNDLYIMKFIKNNLESVVNISIVEFAELIHVSPAAITRLSKKLDFEGFSHFKYYIKETLDKSANQIQEKHNLFSSSVILEDAQATIKMFENNKQTRKIYDLLITKKRIFAYPTGHSQKLMLEEFSRCLLNNNVYLIIIPTVAEFDLIKDNLNDEDVLIVASLSGNANNIEEIIKSIKINNTKIISVTMISPNRLAKLSDYNLYYQVTNINTVKNLNNSSFFALNLLFSLLFEGLTNYINNELPKVTSE